MGRGRRRTLGHTTVVALVALAGCTGGDDAGDGGRFDLFDSGEDDAGFGPTTTGVPTGTGADRPAAVERPDVDQVDCSSLLNEGELEALLGLAELPFRERAFFEILGGETCRYEWTSDSTRTARTEPGHPSDFDAGTELLGATGTPVGAVGDRAAWFAAEHEGLLAVEATTALGRLNYRVTISNHDVDDDTRRAAALEAARRMLPRFPGVEPTPAPEVDLADELPDRRDEDLVQRVLADEAAGADRGELVLALVDAMVAGEPVADGLEGFPASMTGVVALARRVVIDGPDPVTAATLDALLADLFPTRERLALATIRPPTPSTTSTTSTTSPTSPTVAANGFAPSRAQTSPCDEPAPTYGCIVTLNIPELDNAYGDSKYLVYVPDGPPDGFVGWSNDEVGLMIDAVRESATFFEAHGAMPLTSIVMAPSGPGPTAVDAAQGLCTVAVYPGIMDYGEQNAKQFVAGQMAHCFLSETIPPPSGVYDPNLWWTSGAAIWLSNEVFPDTNLEWFRLPQELARHELGTSLTQRTQTNAMWFQHARWAYGLEQLISLLGDLNQGASLAGQAGIDQTFHDFATSLSDLGVPDSGSDQMAGIYQPEAHTFEIDGPIGMLDAVHAFRVSRIELSIADGKHACVESEVAGGALLSWRTGERRETGVWSRDVPDTLEGDVIVAATSTADGGFMRISVTDVFDDPEDCEPDEEDGGSGGGVDDDCIDVCGSSEFYSEP